jgi:hypothetical protein
MTFNLPSPLPRVDVVYSKTAAGRREVEQRGATLNARQRAALIMIDGQRDATALTRLIPAEEVASVLATLIALGLIAGPEASPAEGPALHAPEPAALAAIKAELIAAAEAYLGVMANGIVARVRQAGDAAQLLRILGHWHMAMQDSKNGRDTAASLLEKTKHTLQETALP